MTFNEFLNKFRPKPVVVIYDEHTEKCNKVLREVCNRFRLSIVTLSQPDTPEKHDYDKRIIKDNLFAVYVDIDNSNIKVIRNAYDMKTSVLTSNLNRQLSIYNLREQS